VLAGAGVGSYAATRISGGLVDRAKYLLPLAVGVLLLVLPLLFQATLGWPLAVRIAVSLVVVAPLATLMGFAFPLGMERFGEERKAWFWALNGATGVLAGVASLALAMTIGYANVLALGLAAYLLAVFLLPTQGARVRA
jgi:hypothetical protein